MRYIILTFLLSISSFSQNLAGFYNDQISVAPGEIIEIDLIISNEEEVAAFQFNISNPSAFEIQSIVLNEIFSDFQISYNNETGKIIMFSSSGSIIPVGDQQYIFTIALMVSNDLNLGEYDLTFINPIFASSTATELVFETPPLSETSNMISVQSAAADGTANDQDGNTFEWINYGEFDWSIENAEVVSYRDGTPIPQVTDDIEWSQLTTGAWSYINNNPNEEKVYNWYAVAGIHDNDAGTPNKELAPMGWHIPSDSDWTSLENFLIDNGYSFEGDTSGVGIAKSMASDSGWSNSSVEGAVGNNQSINNSSGFNAMPSGFREAPGYYDFISQSSVFWTSTINDENSAFNRDIYFDRSYVVTYDSGNLLNKGFLVRFARNASTASLNEYTNLINIFPNPSSKYINVNIDSELEAVVFDLLGKELIRENITNKLDISLLEKGTYILNLTDGINTSTHKIIKE